MTAHIDRAQVAEIAEQIKSSLDEDNDQWTNRFLVPSRSKPDVFYRVAQRKSDGSWGCDCWAWKRKRKCPHLIDILGRLAELVETARSRFDAAALEFLAGARTAYLNLDGPALAVSVPDEPVRQLDL